MYLTLITANTRIILKIDVAPAQLSFSTTTSSDTRGLFAEKKREEASLAPLEPGMQHLSGVLPKTVVVRRVPD